MNNLEFSDAFDSPDSENFIRHIFDEVFPGMKNSTVFVHLYSDKPDGKITLELGMSLMLDKSMVVIADHNDQIPRKLSVVSDKIIKVNHQNIEESENIFKNEMVEFVEKLKENPQPKPISLMPEKIGEKQFILAAMMIGNSVLKDKPLFLGFQPGINLPDKLARITDRFIEIDENNKDDIENIIKDVYADYENENDLN